MRPDDLISDVPRWLQIALGIIIGVFAVLLTFASLMLALDPAAKSPLLNITIGGMMVLLGSWVIAKAARLTLGRPIKGGLLSPCALRVTSIVVLCFVVCGLFVGHVAKHPVRGAIQSILYVGLSFYLWQLARYRATQSWNKAPNQATPPPSPSSENLVKEIVSSSGKCKASISVDDAGVYRVRLKVQYFEDYTKEFWWRPYGTLAFADSLERAEELAHQEIKLHPDQ